MVVSVDLGRGDARVTHVGLKVAQRPDLRAERAERVPEIVEAQRRSLLMLMAKASTLERPVEAAA